MAGTPFKLKSQGSPFKMMGSSSSPLRDEKTSYKGMTKAEVRASVHATNKGKGASDKSRQNLSSEIKLWRLANREIKLGPPGENVKTEIRKKEAKPVEKKETGWAVKVGGLTAGTGSKYEKAIKK